MSATGARLTCGTCLVGPTPSACRASRGGGGSGREDGVTGEAADTQGNILPARRRDAAGPADARAPARRGPRAGRVPDVRGRLCGGRVRVRRRQRGGRRAARGPRRGARRVHVVRAQLALPAVVGRAAGRAGGAAAQPARGLPAADRRRVRAPVERHDAGRRGRGRRVPRAHQQARRRVLRVVGRRRRARRRGARAPAARRRRARVPHRRPRRRRRRRVGRRARHAGPVQPR